MFGKLKQLARRTSHQLGCQRCAGKIVPRADAKQLFNMELYVTKSLGLKTTESSKISQRERLPREDTSDFG